MGNKCHKDRKYIVITRAVKDDFGPMEADSHCCFFR